MPPILGTSAPAIARRIVTAIAGLMFVMSSNVFEIRGDASTAALTSGDLLIFSSGSGSGLTAQRRQVGSVDKLGNLSMSGVLASRLLANCSSVSGSSTGALQCGSGGSGISQTNADARYVNTSGDTMTGNLIVHATISGSTLSGTTIRAKTFSPTDVTLVLGTGTTLSTGSGKAWFTVPKVMSGMKLTAVSISVDTAGTTNITSVQIRNNSKGNRKMLSTVVSIDSSETDSSTAATPAVIDTSASEIGYRDRIYIDIPAKSDTAPKGLSVNLQFSTP